jgi:hypothetical protein
MEALAIVNWSQYERADSRKCQTMHWVATPVSHDGIGYIELVSHPDGLAHFGAWNIILQTAACCPERGLLVSDSGRALTPRLIALRARVDIGMMQAAVDRLLEIGWLEQVTAPSGSHPEAIRKPSGQSRGPSGLQDSTGHNKTAAAGARAPARQPAQQPPSDWVIELETVGAAYVRGDLAKWDSLRGSVGMTILTDAVREVVATGEKARFAAVIPVAQRLAGERQEERPNPRAEEIAAQKAAMRESLLAAYEGQKPEDMPAGMGNALRKLRDGTYDELDLSDLEERLQQGAA